MKIDMPNTTVSKIQKKLVHIREEGGAVALGRVLTLIISTASGTRKRRSTRRTRRPASTRCA